jgi:hypothetical protein
LGIGGIDLTQSTDGVNFSRENISVSVRQKAEFDLTRINVVIAP